MAVLPRTHLTGLNLEATLIAPADVRALGQALIQGTQLWYLSVAKSRDYAFPDPVGDAAAWETLVAARAAKCEVQLAGRWMP